jgi:hypothetical protein
MRRTVAPFGGGNGKNDDENDEKNDDFNDAEEAL